MREGGRYAGRGKGGDGKRRERISYKHFVSFNCPMAAPERYRQSPSRGHSIHLQRRGGRVMEEEHEFVSGVRGLRRKLSERRCQHFGDSQ
jgi:hypothetical protein